MKTIVTLLCLLFIAVTLPVSARNQPASTQIQDTLIIKLQNRNQVYIIGNSLKNLTDYQRADTLKNYFFADLEKTLVVNNFPEMPKRIYYLINQTTKRRLKAEIPGETEPVFDLEFEKKRLTQDLPPLHYTIYDLPQNVEIHYFLEDTSAFALAEQTSLNAAILKLKEDRKKLAGLTSYRLEQNAFGFEKRNPEKKKEFILEWNPGIGAMLLGNQPSPVLSYDLFMTISSNRFRKYRIGASFNAFVLTDFIDGKFKQINQGINLNGYHQINLATLNRPNLWFGLNGGILSTDLDTGLKANTFKWGLMITQGQNIFVADLIKVGKRKSLPMLTYKRTIF